MQDNDWPNNHDNSQAKVVILFHISPYRANSPVEGLGIHLGKSSLCGDCNPICIGIGLGSQFPPPRTLLRNYHVGVMLVVCSEISSVRKTGHEARCYRWRAEWTTIPRIVRFLASASVPT